MNTAWAPACLALRDILAVLAGTAHALLPESTALNILECFCLKPLSFLPWAKCFVIPLLEEGRWWNHDPEKWPDLTKVTTEGHDQAKKSMRSTLEFASLSSLQRLFWLMILAAERQVQYPGWWEQGLQSLWALTPPLLLAFSSLQAQWLYFSSLRDGKCCSIPLWWFKSVMCLFLFPLYIQLSPFSGLLLHSFP